MLELSLSSSIALSIAQDISVLHREINDERKKMHSQDFFLSQMLKTMKVMFRYVDPNQDFPQLETKDLKEFSFLSDAKWNDPTLAAHD